MKIEYITNASFLFTFSDGLTILTDPWYQNGIYHGILFNYPPIENTQKEKYLKLKPDYIYISHIHGDHFDPDTLVHYSLNTPIIIGKFIMPALKLALNKIGFKNVIEFDFDKLVKLKKHKICVFGEFSSSSDDLENETNIPIDTSIYLEDFCGNNVFFSVDNPMQERNAKYMHNRFDKIDCAILSYSGASCYPFVFKHYKTEDKHKRAKKLKYERVNKFCHLAKIINAKVSIPAAGSMVIGGVGAKYTPYLHQATPKQIRDTWQKNNCKEEKLNILTTGDELNLANNKTTYSKLAIDRNFTEEDRINYAKSIASFPCNLHNISWPSSLYLPWHNIIFKSRMSMWLQQEKLKVYPKIDVYLHINTTKKIPFIEQNTIHAKISMTNKIVTITNEYKVDKNNNRIEFYMSNQLLLALLLGSTYWNVAEYHMKITRHPDQFSPTLQRLLSYFKL